MKVQIDTYKRKVLNAFDAMTKTFGYVSEMNLDIKTVQSLSDGDVYITLIATVKTNRKYMESLEPILKEITEWVN